MGESRFFCAERARARGEAIFGTAARVDTWLLLETPGAWSSQALPLDRLPLNVRRHFADMATRIPRSRRLLIRQRHAHHEELSFFRVQSRKEPRAWRTRLPGFEDLLSLDPATARNAATEIATSPMYLVCTHGRHDKCCAKFGYATYCAMRDKVGDSVWQCSHVGGDRFAANVVYLPHGIYYGNVFPDNAASLLDAGRNGKISLQHYRGRSSYSRPAQVGEYLIRKETGLLGINDLELHSAQAAPTGNWLVTFHDAKSRDLHEVEFRPVENVFRQLLTCNSSEPAPVTQYELVRYSSARSAG